MVFPFSLGYFLCFLLIFSPASRWSLFYSLLKKPRGYHFFSYFLEEQGRDLREAIAQNSKMTTEDQSLIEFLSVSLIHTEPPATFQRQPKLSASALVSTECSALIRLESLHMSLELWRQKKTYYFLICPGLLKSCWLFCKLKYKSFTLFHFQTPNPAMKLLTTPQILGLFS